MAKRSSKGSAVPIDRTHRRKVGPLAESGHTLRRPRQTAMRLPKAGKTGKG